VYSRIVLAIDESPAAAHALEHTIALAGGLSAALRILHVVDMGWLPAGPELGIDVDAIAAARRTAGEKLLASSVERAWTAGIDAETRLVDTTRGPDDSRRGCSLARRPACRGHTRAARRTTSVTR
jgi:nucleotide-binding universal stress UspA family protein